MPLPSFHACRLREVESFSPDAFGAGERFRIVRGRRGVEVVVGRLEGTDRFLAAAVRYPSDNWTPGEARKAREGVAFSEAGDSSKLSDVLAKFEAYEGNLEPAVLEKLFDVGLAYNASTLVFEDKPLETVDLPGVEIFAAGTWTDAAGRKRTFTLDHIRAMVAKFRELGDRVRPFFKLRHLGPNAHLKVAAMPRLGSLTNFREAGGKLVVDILGVPKLVGDLIKAKAYDRISAEIVDGFVDEGGDGKKHNNVVIAAGLLGATLPAVTTLQDVRALYGADAEVEDFLGPVCPGGDDYGECYVTGDSLVFGFYKSDYTVETERGGKMPLTDDQVKALVKSELETGLEGATKAALAPIRKALGIGEDADVGEAITKLKKDATAGTTAKSEHEKQIELTAIDELLAKGKKAGKIRPADEKLYRAMLEKGLDAPMKYTNAEGKEAEGTVGKAFEAMLAGMPQLFTLDESGKIVEEESGSGDKSLGNIPADVALELAENKGEYTVDRQSLENDRKVRAYMAKHEGTDYHDACVEVLGFSTITDPALLSGTVVE